jgi:hypothetical protein
MFGILTHADFELQTIEEARALSAFISNFYREPARIIVGLAALLINAVEHGNLGIGYDEKSRLVSEGTLDDEIAHRLASKENANKKVRVNLVRDPDKIVVYIRDEGQGFDWKAYMDFDPSRVTDPNGRGIAMANIMVPGAIEYLGKGNEVRYIINLKEEGQQAAPSQAGNFTIREQAPSSPESSNNF